MKTRFWYCLCVLIAAFPARGLEWKSLERFPVAVMVHPEDDSYGRELVSVAMEHLPRIFRDLGVEKPSEIRIFVAGSEKEFIILTQRQIPEWGIGASDPVHSAIYMKSPRFGRPDVNYRQVLVHELSHVVLGMATGGRDVPRWFDEGFALYESGESGLGQTFLLARSFFTGSVYGLHEIEDVLTFERERAALAYQESLSAVQYLIRKYGKPVLKVLAWNIRREGDMERAFQTAFGYGLDTFEKEWMLSTRRRFRWYILFDFHFLVSTAFIILFGAALYAARRKRKLKRREWELENEQSLQAIEEDTTSL